MNSHFSNPKFEIDKGEIEKEDEKKDEVVTIKLGKFKNVDGSGEGEDEGEIAISFFCRYINHESAF